MSMKNSSDTIGNRTRDLPSCSAVPQLTAASRAPVYDCIMYILYFNISYIQPNWDVEFENHCSDLIHPFLDA